MRSWILDLKYVSGALTGDRIRPPRGTQLREMGIALLGEHATFTGAHDNDLKPRALWLDPPGPRHRGTLQITWLSDHWPPLRTPPAAGRLNWGQGTSVVEFATRSDPFLITAAALHHYFLDNPATENWATCRLHTRSGVLFKRGHTHYLSAAHILDSLINRWNLVTTWAPPGHPEPLHPPAIPDATLACLSATFSLETVRLCAPATPHQVATRIQQRNTGIQETALEFDIDVQCADEKPTTLAWFRTLCKFAEIASIGRYTATGLGAVTTIPHTDRKPAP